MENIYNKDGKVIRRSRNLRGIRLHINKNIVKQIEIEGQPTGEGMFKVMFDNGDHYETEFASFTVLCCVLRAWRGAYGAPLSINGKQAGTVKYDNESLKGAIP